MANEQQLRLLVKKGVSAWNAWREKNRHIRADLRRADFSRADLVMADLIMADLIMANLSGADLRGANLAGSHLSGAVLRGADLVGANLSGADLSRANLIGSHLSGADLSTAVLVGANLSGADLSRANLRGARLFSSHLSGADLSRAELSHSVFGDIDLSEVKGLDTVQHRGPSTIGIDTIYLSGGNIPESFLRGCGLSDLQILMVKLHNPNLSSVEVTDLTYAIHNIIVSGAIHYHSCFISYSSKDQAFSEQLYQELQDNGVRCWFAPEHMKIGQRIRAGIDESIRIHDKLLLILSEYSISSAWIEQEVETALAKERERDELILFPIRLDDSVMKIDKGWPSLIRNTRHIGDFRQWENPTHYQKALQRLLNNLQIGVDDKKGD